LKYAIGLDGSFSYPFDSLKKLGKLTSPDHNFRMYNWNLPQTNGTNRYFCFLQVPDKNHKGHFRIIELNDKSDTIQNPEFAALSYRNWYGALYYRIIPEKTGSVTLYTLLGWQGLNLLQMQKVIEILTFDYKGNPQFGKKVFYKYQNGENKRVIFNYSSTTSMSLRFDESTLSKNKRWNASRKKFDPVKEKVHMIIYDRLVRLESRESREPLQVPAGDAYDGFIFVNGRWNFISGVDARNN